MSKRKYKEYLSESVNPRIPKSTRYRMKKQYALFSSEDGCSSHNELGENSTGCEV